MGWHTGMADDEFLAESYRQLERDLREAEGFRNFYQSRVDELTNQLAAWQRKEQ